MLKFDPLRLTRVEKSAWASYVSRSGPEGVEQMFDLVASWVVGFVGQGKTSAEIRAVIVGTFYDNVPLMHRGQAIRNETIILAKAMVEQAIDALST